MDYLLQRLLFKARETSSTRFFPEVISPVFLIRLHVQSARLQMFPKEGKQHWEFLMIYRNASQAGCG